MQIWTGGGSEGGRGSSNWQLAVWRFGGLAVGKGKRKTETEKAEAGIDVIGQDQYNY